MFLRITLKSQGFIAKYMSNVYLNFTRAYQQFRLFRLLVTQAVQISWSECYYNLIPSYSKSKNK